MKILPIHKMSNNTNNSSILVTGGPFYALQMCDSESKSEDGFQWPQLGYVECPDWVENQKCSNGLHGFLNGEGDGPLANWEPNARWLVLKLDTYVDLVSKIKFPNAEVLYNGDRLTATTKLRELIGNGFAIIGSVVTAGNYGVAIAGYKGTATVEYGGVATVGSRGAATAGHGGVAIAGDSGIATAGNGGAAIAGEDGAAIAGEDGAATATDMGTATVGDAGAAIAGNSGTATAGNDGTAIAGHGGRAKAGDDGVAIAGDGGVVSAGDRGTAITEYGGIASAGDSGTIIIKYYNGDRYRFVVGYIGEDGLEPNVKYKLNNKHKFVRV